MENLVQWAERFGQSLDALPDEKRRDVLRLLVDQVVIDQDNNVKITLGIASEDLMSIEEAESRSQNKLRRRG
jgi:DNA-binding transcriptional ArsR family regulator